MTRVSTFEWSTDCVPSRVWTVPSLCSWKFWKIQDNFDLDGQLDSIAPEARSNPTARRGRNYLEFFKIFMNIGTELSTLIFVYVKFELIRLTNSKSLRCHSRRFSCKLQANRQDAWRGYKACIMTAGPSKPLQRPSARSQSFRNHSVKFDGDIDADGQLMALPAR